MSRVMGRILVMLLSFVWVLMYVIVLRRRECLCLVFIIC